MVWKELVYFYRVFFCMDSIAWVFFTNPHPIVYVITTF